MKQFAVFGENEAASNTVPLLPGPQALQRQFCKFAATESATE